MNDAVSLIDAEDLSIILLTILSWSSTTPPKKKFCYEVTHNRGIPCRPPNDICPLNETVQKSRTAHAEHIHMLPDGSKTFAEITTSPTMDERGRGRLSILPEI